MKNQYYYSTFDSYARGSDARTIAQVEAYGSTDQIHPPHCMSTWCSDNITSLNYKLTQLDNPPYQPVLPLPLKRGEKFLHFKPCSCDDENHCGCPNPFLVSRDGTINDGQFFANVDLVIAASGHTALDCINSFDLDVCQNSFDGTTFHLVNPSNLFDCGKKVVPSKAFSPVATIVSCADDLLAFFAPPFDELTTADRLQSLEKVSPDKGNVFLRFIWEKGCHFGYHSPKADSTEMVDLIALRNLVKEVHTFIYKSVERIEKYRKRDIHVKDAEHVPQRYIIPPHHEHKPNHEVVLMHIHLSNGAKAGWQPNDFVDAAMKYNTLKQ